MTEFTCVRNRAFSTNISASMFLNTLSGAPSRAPFGLADPAVPSASCARSFACAYVPKLEVLRIRMNEE